jgi:hypothetical protein
MHHSNTVTSWRNRLANLLQMLLAAELVLSRKLVHQSFDLFLGFALLVRTVMSTICTAVSAKYAQSLQA